MQRAHPPDDREHYLKGAKAPAGLTESVPYLKRDAKQVRFPYFATPRVSALQRIDGLTGAGTAPVTRVLVAT